MKANKNDSNDFKYNYIAPTTTERKEIESIRNSYIEEPVINTKIKTLRKLDRKVKNTPTIISLIIGIVGTLTFGLGLSMILEWDMRLSGLAVMLVGIILIPLAYPTYTKSFKYFKKKYSDKIIKLSNELLNDERD